MNSSGVLPFVITVVPLREVWFNFRRRAWNYQFARSSRALSWADKYASERDFSETQTEFPRQVLAMCSQRKVRATGVLAGKRPFGFAVSNEVNAREHIHSLKQAMIVSITRFDSFGSRTWMDTTPASLAG